MRVPVLVFGIGLLALVGCDSSTSDRGSFNITVEGGESTSFSGEPTVDISTRSFPGRSFRVYRFGFEAPDGSPSASVSAVPEDDAELTEGEYQIVEVQNDPGSGRAMAMAVFGEGDEFIFASRVGTLTITSVTADRIRGEFEFEGSNFGVRRNEITVRGSFEADPDVGLIRR